MGARPDLERLVFDGAVPFDERALEVFRYQRAECPPYRRFCDALGVGLFDPKTADEIPLMPIGLFKEVPVICGSIENVPLRFRSSATGGIQSSHWVAEPEMYRQSVLQGFKLFYGDAPGRLWTYLPGYSDNPESSLVYMAVVLREYFGLENCWEVALGKLLSYNDISSHSHAGKPVLLLGAAFGLLDLIEAGVEKGLPEGSIVIETGGMKTHRRERSREELHRELSEGFGVPLEQVHSEYGMAELLSQAYAQGGPWYRTPHWMRVEVRDPLRPLTHLGNPFNLGTNQLGVIDLANLYSCGFLLTGDRGILRGDGSFQVLGRMDASDLRGCNFLMERD